MSGYNIPEGSNSVELRTLRILCEKDNYKLLQDRQQTIQNVKLISKPQSLPPQKSENLNYWRDKVRKSKSTSNLFKSEHTLG